MNKTTHLSSLMPHANPTGYIPVDLGLGLPTPEISKLNLMYTSNKYR